CDRCRRYRPAVAGLRLLRPVRRLRGTRRSLPRRRPASHPRRERRRMSPAAAQAHHAFARSDRSAIGVWWWTVDRWMLGVVALLIAVGVVIAFAASPAAAARMNIGDPFHFAVRQCLFAAISAVILVGVSMLEVQGVKRSDFFIWLVAIAMLIALPLLGQH